LGCDVYKHGISQFGPARAAQILSMLDSSECREDQVASFLCSEKNSQIKDVAVYKCLARALILEPVSSGYIVDNPPMVFEQYLQDFKSEEATIMPGPLTAECVGCNGSKHTFLEAEGTHQCTVCWSTICRHCIFDLTKISVDNAIKCMACARSELAGEFGSSNATEADMRNSMAEKHICVPAAASYVDVFELYEEMIDDENMSSFGKLIDDVRYPLEATTVLHPSSGVIKRLSEAVPVHSISDLIRDKEIAGQQVAGLIHVLASLVDLGHNHSKGAVSYHHVLSNNVLDWAKNARIDTGERLCKRAV
jgi:hypothetical protein